MITINDINESERNRVVIKKGKIVCIFCEKNKTKISEYGMLRACTKCEGRKRGPTISIDEPNGRRSY